MSRKAKPARDAFTLSLDGIKTINSFIVAPAIDTDRINKAIDARLRQAQKAQPNQPDTASEIGGVLKRFWPFRGRRAA
jgi:hypothetical protein